MTKKCAVPEQFANITNAMLLSWAGLKVFERGDKYFRAAHVHDMVLVSDGRRIATVDGSRPYSTAIMFQTGAELESMCTCPYGSNCKHAVALALACAKTAAAGQDLPLASETDRRLYALGLPEESELELPDLKGILQNMDREELLAILLKAAAVYPAIALLCNKPETTTDSKSIKYFVNEARKAMYAEAEDDDYDGFQSPNRDALPACFRGLWLAGQLETVLGLARELLEEIGREPDIWIYDDTSADAVNKSMAITRDVLKAMDWPISQKLIWAAETYFMANYGFSDAIEDMFMENYPPEVWQPLAEHMLERLKAFHGNKYERNSCLGLTIRILEKAGRSAEVFELRRRDALEMKDYSALARLLIDAGKYDEAQKYIRDGLHASDGLWLGDRRLLRDLLLEIYQKQEDWDAAIVLLAEDFVRRPSVELYYECCEIASKMGCSPLIATLLEEYLIDRSLPWKHSRWPGAAKGMAEIDSKNPAYDTLVALSLDRKDPVSALKWYDQCMEKYKQPCYSSNLLADAIRGVKPQRAMELWREAIEAKIGETNSRAYEESMPILQKLHDCMRENGMSEQWLSYVAGLRAAYKRKRSFVTMLDELLKGLPNSDNR